MKKIGFHFYIKGRVQGVFFRYHAHRVATQLGLKGWVRNLADGRVELKAFGEALSLQKLKIWLEKGPPLAKVEQVITHSIAYEEKSSFEIKN